ncbi:hypothetical protein KQH60_09870 [Mycetohabitans sp. B8]|uniref:hypothetical protein n=1 Tax=Mycetohabitans sp. B8 TaxID=2841845 RepID=UPI001F2341DB|nr:hypothetical protein [Mycetohabitans sp. B8]MCG1042825.1 hypothetical protein [Mycetohabitans sp. B8]
MRNLNRLSKWLMEQPEQSLTNVITRLEAGQLSNDNQRQLLTCYQANPVGGGRTQFDTSFTSTSVGWLQKLRAWEFEQALNGIELPGVKGPVPAEIDTQVKRELVAVWLATQSSTRTDEEVLQQAPHLWNPDKAALRSLARWFTDTYSQTDKLDCIVKNAKPDMVHLITELFNSSVSGRYKNQIAGAIKRLQSKEKITYKRHLDAQLHTDDKLAINVIKQHSFNYNAITAFKQFATWERGQPQPVGLAQIIANPDYQAHSERLLKAFDNADDIPPIYKIRVKREILKAQGSDELKQALRKLLS